MKSKYKKGDEVFIIEFCRNYICIKVRINKVIRNLDGTYTYKIWRYRSRNEQGNFWVKEKLTENYLFKSYVDAKNYVDSLLTEFELYFLAEELKEIEEIPPVPDKYIKKWNRENCI